MLGESLHAHGLGSVVAGVEHVDAQLFRVEEGPMRTFAGDERVEPGSRGLWNEGAPCPGNDPDPPYLRRTEGEEARRSAERRRECAGELVARRVQLTPHAD